jgi:hypothetical protein
MSDMNSTTLSLLLESSENKDFIRPDIESETIKKPRKKREKKISELDKLGWDTSLSWSLPRFKKYMNDEERDIVSIKTGISFKNGSDSLGGIVLTVQRGPRVEDILIITEFSLDWINNVDFIRLIKPFTSTSKSSKFILISPYSKSWGKSKVAIGNKMLNKIIADHWDESIPVTVLDMNPGIEVMVIGEDVKKLKIKKKLRVRTVISTTLNMPEAELCEVGSDELKSILVNFSDSINKVVESFKNLKDSLTLVTNLGKDIEAYLGNK